MWKNVGNKVKIIAKIMCWAGIVLSVIAGIALIISGQTAQVTIGSSYLAVNGVVGGILVIILGSLGAWLGSLATYALGEAADYAEKH